jgi:hypothetical protein
MVCFQLVPGPYLCGIAGIQLPTRTWTAAMWYRQHILLDRLAETLWWLERTGARVGWPREGEYYA